MKKVNIILLLAFCLDASTSYAAPEPELEGSDTLFDITNYLTDALGIQPSVLTYIGGGSGNGESAMERNEQEIAPMSRYLDEAACAANASAGCWIVGGDAIAMVGNQNDACSALNWGDTIEVQDVNGVAGLQCDGCSGSQYTFSDWRTVLRIIYAGQDQDGVDSQDCNSDIRHTLINNWSNLFRGSCSSTSCSELEHAWRRDDTSGTTATFLSLLELPDVASAPFCNGMEVQDNDPIRRTCRGNGFAGDGDEVCGIDGTLGVVLPALIPQDDPYAVASGAPANKNCGNAAFGGAAFGDVGWTFSDIGRYGSNCPNGLPQVGGTCKWPKRAGSSAGSGFGCIAGRNDRPNGSPNTVDARVYNLWTRNADGTVVQYTRNGVQNQRANVSYYRAHQIAGCQLPDATGQLGCFVDSDTCSIGYAGQSAITDYTNVVGLGLRSTNTPYRDVFPTPQDFASYGLSRNLFFCTIDDFANTGNQSSAFVSAQQQIRNALTDPTPTEVSDAVGSAGFISTDPTQPLTFEACP